MMMRYRAVATYRDTVWTVLAPQCCDGTHLSVSLDEALSALTAHLAQRTGADVTLELQVSISDMEISTLIQDLIWLHAEAERLEAHIRDLRAQHLDVAERGQAAHRELVSRLRQLGLPESAITRFLRANGSSRTTPGP